MNFEIPDRNDRLVVFDGDLLTRASSDDGKAQRWSETEIYRTEQGRYIVHTIGRSAVYHEVGSVCTRQAKEVSIREELAKNGALELVACRKCHPADGDHVLLEQDRHNVTVIEKPRGVIEALHDTDDDGVEYLTRLARHALEGAAAADPAVAAAWNVRAV